ncbi:unnamed protein product, partial [Iphiclides podalirius]
MVAAAKLFKIPVYVSEQYPKGLGHTTKDINIEEAFVYEKTKFSMYTPELLTQLKKDVQNLGSVVIFGIEAHVCIEQTAIDLLNEDIAVHVLADGVSSRSLMDRGLALQRLQSIGCFVGTSENVLFKLLKDKNNEAFKDVSKLNLIPTPDEFGMGLPFINDKQCN